MYINDRIYVHGKLPHISTVFSKWAAGITLWTSGFCFHIIKMEQLLAIYDVVHVMYLLQSNVSHKTGLLN